MKTYVPQALSIVFFASLLNGCANNEPVVGQCGEYKVVRGMAVVTAIKPVKTDDCAHQGQAVYFRFMPVPGAKDPRPEINPSVRLETVNTAVFPLSWLKDKNWTVGTQHEIEKHVALGGVCAPFVFRTAEITENDVPAIQAACNAVPAKPYAVDNTGASYEVNVQTASMWVTPEQAETGSTVQMGVNVASRVPIPGFMTGDRLKAAVSWSVNTVNQGVTITPKGLLTVAPQARHNSLHQVTAKVVGRSRPVMTKVRVFSKTVDPLIGDWKDKRKVINELSFLPGNRFSVTRVPFESYKDYGGTYRIDPAKRMLSMIITGGNKVPPDAALSNVSYSFDAVGNLVLKNVFFGTIRTGDQKQNQYVFTR